MIPAVIPAVISRPWQAVAISSTPPPGYDLLLVKVWRDGVLTTEPVVDAAVNQIFVEV